MFWYYNNWDFNALGTIYEQVVKASIFEEFKSRIADPLEMEDFRIADGSYVRGPESIHAAYLLDDRARHGALRSPVLCGADSGVADPSCPGNGWRRVPWAFSDLGQSGGYGYLWWVAPNGGPHFTSSYFNGRVFSAPVLEATSSWWFRIWTSWWSIASIRTSRAGK